MPCISYLLLGMAFGGITMLLERESMMRESPHLTQIGLRKSSNLKCKSGHGEGAIILGGVENVRKH